MKLQKNLNDKESSFSLILRELNQQACELSTPDEITVSELEEINLLRETVLETTQSRIICRSTT